VKTNYDKNTTIKQLSIIMLNTAIESNVTFSSGPSRNNLSMYSTTHSMTYPNHQNRLQKRSASEGAAAAETWKLKYPQKAGHVTNTLPYRHVPSFEPPEQRTSTAPAKMTITEMKAFRNRYVDPGSNDVHRESMMKSSFRRDNTVHNDIHHAPVFNQSIRDGQLTNDNLQKSMPTGYSTNEKGFTHKQHLQPRDQSPHEYALKLMKTRNHIESENEGRGPSAMTTTNSVYHNKKPLADTEIPSSLSHIDDNKVRSIMFSGGFINNRRITKVGPIGTQASCEQVPDDLHPDQTMKTTYKTTIAAPNTHKPKYYKSHIHGMDHISHQETMALREDKNKRWKDSFSAYSKSEYPVGGPEHRVVKRLSPGQMFKDDHIHDSVRSIIKKHDPVEHDSLNVKDTMLSTYSRGYNQNNITFETVEPQTARAVMQSVRSKRITSGFTRNNNTESAKKMKDPEVSLNPVLQSQLHSNTTYNTTHKHPIHLEATDHPMNATRTVNTVTGYTRSIRRNVPYVSKSLNNEYGLTKLSENLTSDLRDLNSKHPTIQKMLLKRRPAQYDTNVVSMYGHKTRIAV
jgi:hypothetical protein